MVTIFAEVIRIIEDLILALGTGSLIYAKFSLILVVAALAFNLVAHLFASKKLVSYKDIVLFPIFLGFAFYYYLIRLLLLSFAVAGLTIASISRRLVMLSGQDRLSSFIWTLFKMDLGRAATANENQMISDLRKQLTEERKKSQQANNRAKRAEKSFRDLQGVVEFMAVRNMRWQEVMNLMPEQLLERGAKMGRNNSNGRQQQDAKFVLPKEDAYSRSPYYREQYEDSELDYATVYVS